MQLKLLGHPPLAPLLVHSCLPLDFNPSRGYRACAQLLSSFLPQTVDDVEGSGKNARELMDGVMLYAYRGIPSFETTKGKNLKDSMDRAGGWNMWEAKKLNLDFCDLPQVQ